MLLLQKLGGAGAGDLVPALLKGRGPVLDLGLGASSEDLSDLVAELLARGDLGELREAGGRDHWVYGTPPRGRRARHRGVRGSDGKFSREH